ncbi:MAG TPA: hypothetical protein ENI05_02845 [Porticoccus sp.]|nr:hypothetical protein [Porticoccus sp.]
MRAFVIILCIIVSSNATACFAPPLEQHVRPLELISRTERIVLAKVINASSEKNSYEVLYKFETIKTLKGKVRDTFTIEGHPLYQGGMTNFNNHSDPDFWEESWGRESNDADCEIYPSFSVGAIFLIFLDRPYHSKSFENIILTNGDKNIKDKWLQYVEEQVSLNTLLRVPKN